MLLVIAESSTRKYEKRTNEARKGSKKSKMKAFGALRVEEDQSGCFFSMNSENDETDGGNRWTAVEISVLNPHIVVEPDRDN